MLRFTNKAVEAFGNTYISTKNNEYIFICPKCGRQKLYVNLTNGVYHCFRCDYSGKLKERTNLKDIKEKHDFNSLKNETKKRYNKSLNKELSLIYFESKPLTNKQIIALKNRGITASDIKFYNICGRSTDNRIQIPNYIRGSFTDVICAWEYDKSKITKTNPKYLNSEGTLKSETLFNIYNIEKESNQIILCEGIFNAITAGRNAIASYGCSFSDRQCEILLDWVPKSILLAYDSDEAGVTGTLKVIKMLKEYKYQGLVEYILLPKGVDINDLGHDNFISYVSTHKVKIDLSSPISRNLPKMLFDSQV